MGKQKLKHHFLGVEMKRPKSDKLYISAASRRERRREGMKSTSQQQAAAQVCWQSCFGAKKFKVLGKACLEHSWKEEKEEIK